MMSLSPTMALRALGMRETNAANSSRVWRATESTTVMRRLRLLPSSVQITSDTSPGARANTTTSRSSAAAACTIWLLPTAIRATSGAGKMRVSPTNISISAWGAGAGPGCDSHCALAIPSGGSGRSRGDAAQALLKTELRPIRAQVSQAASHLHMPHIAGPPARLLDCLIRLLIPPPLELRWGQTAHLKRGAKSLLCRDHPPAAACWATHWADGEWVSPEVGLTIVPTRLRARTRPASG